jgi:DNA-binding NarL/FixJ family response regulator
MIPITIWIVEDDSIYRNSLESMLTSQDQITCTQVFASCIPFLKAIETEERPDVVLMDLGLPRMSGTEGIKKLKDLAPDIAVLVLTAFKEKVAVLEALEAGAAGYLLKTANRAEIIKAIQDVFMGQSALSPTIAKIALEEIRKPVPVDTFNLTGREIEVLELLAEGLAVQEISDKLSIKIRTTGFHLTNIYEKLQVPSSTGAVAKALRAGIIG